MVAVPVQRDDGVQAWVDLLAGADREAVIDWIYWADPARTQPGEINRHYGGRGVYFRDPNGHLLELITRPYGDDLPS